MNQQFPVYALAEHVPVDDAGVDEHGKSDDRYPRTIDAVVGGSQPAYYRE